MLGDFKKDLERDGLVKLWMSTVILKYSEFQYKSVIPGVNPGPPTFEANLNNRLY